VIILLSDAYAGPLAMLAGIVGVSITYWGMYWFMTKRQQKKVKKNFQKTYADKEVKESFPAFAAEYATRSKPYFNANVKPGNDMADDVKKALIMLKVPSNKATQMVDMAIQERNFTDPSEMLEYIFKRWARGSA
jgi:hypothetical protein